MTDFYNNGNFTEENILPKKKRRTVTFVFAGIFLCIGVLIGSAAIFLKFIYIINAKETQEIGRIAVQFSILMVLGIIAVLVITKIKSVNIKANIIFVLSLIIFATQVANYGDYDMIIVKAKAQEDTAYKEVSEITKAGLNGNKIDNTSFSQETYGEYAQFLTYLAGYYNDVVDERNKYEAALQKYNLEKYFTIDILMESNKIDASKNEILKLKEAINVYEENLDSKFKSMKESIESMDMKKSFKDGLITGFDEGTNERNNRLKEYFSIERELIDCHLKLMDFFKGLKGNFSIENKAFLFYEDKDLKQFNTIQAQINELAKKESDWVDNNRKKAEDALSRAL